MPSSRLLARATLVAVLALPQAARAQYFAARTLTPVPLDSKRGVGILRGIDYFSDLQRSYGSAGDDRAWAVRLAAFIDLWRPTARTAVYLSAADEIAANSLKDGGFNPRGISWELGVGVMQRFGSVVGRLGIAHYCKHEVDNSDPPDEEQVPPPGYVPQKRTLSMNALRAEVMTRPFVRGAWSVRGAAAGEVYTTQWDGRRPATTVENSWKRVRSGASAAVRANLAVSPNNALFLRASGIGLHFAGSAEYPVSSPIGHNERLELGWRLTGSGAAMELYTAAEQLFDDVMAVAPRQSRMLGVGVRFSDLNYF